MHKLSGNNDAAIDGVAQDYSDDNEVALAMVSVNGRSSWILSYSFSVLFCEVGCVLSAGVLFNMKGKKKKKKIVANIH